MPLSSPLKRTRKGLGGTPPPPGQVCFVTPRAVRLLQLRRRIFLFCPTFDGQMSSSVTCREIKSFHLQNEYYMIPAGVGTLLATFGVCSSVPPTPPSPSAAETSQSFLQGIKSVSVITSLKKCRDRFHYVTEMVRLIEFFHKHTKLALFVKNY